MLRTHSQSKKLKKVPCAEISNSGLIPARPVVSVQMITYNHEPYIRDAVEGVLMQETEFPIELVVAEDCSSDKTRQIVLDFQRRYPSVIRVLVSEDNVGPMRNSFRAGNACRGKYTALCDGDDYWTDSRKLQKQVCFLESNQEYSMCSHAVDTVFLDGVEPRDPFVEPLKSATFEEIVDRGRFIPTPSIVSRREALPELPVWFLNLRTGHLPYIYMVTQSGKNFHFDDVMAVKRRHPGGITQDPGWANGSSKRCRLKNAVYFYRQLNAWSEYKDKKIIYRETARCCRRIALIGLKNSCFRETVQYTFLTLVYTMLWKGAGK